MSSLRNAIARYWAVLLRDWTSYHTPPGKPGADHLIATLFQRSIVALRIQGFLLLSVGPFVAPRLPVLGCGYLLIAWVASPVSRRFGVRAGWRAGYVVAVIAITCYVPVSGGIYSQSVAALVMLTISSPFIFEIRTTLVALASQTALLGGMSALQSHGMWFDRIITPNPGITWLLVTLMTVNFAIPIVTTIQAYREVLSLLENKVGQLRIAEEEAHKLLDGQRRFFWDISHELRSPLTRLNLSVGKVRRDAAPQAGPSLERMENEVERLNKLIHQLLLLAQLKQGVQFPMDQHFDLVSEVASVCQDAEFEANVAGRDLRLECDKPHSVQGWQMEGCAELLRGALDNVVRNAIRFAPEGSEVEVHFSQPHKGLKLAFSVGDRGPGVPESQIAMLFDPFSARDSGGSGAGAANGVGPGPGDCLRGRQETWRTHLGG